MRTKGKIYISGKVPGVAERDLFKKFNDAELMLSARGFEVINPLKLINKYGETLRWQEAFQKCLDALSECTHIYMLPCAADCEVAKIELDKAMKANFEIHYELENIEVNEPIEIVHGQEQKL